MDVNEFIIVVKPAPVAQPPYVLKHDIALNREMRIFPSREAADRFARDNIDHPCAIVGITAIPDHS